MEPGTSKQLESSQTKQLQIRFITKQEQYSVPDTPFAVQSSISVTELNSLINQLIKESQISEHNQKKVDFDFIAAGEFIRATLGEHLESRSHSTEAVIDVEYLESLPAPKPEDCLLHDDWVSAVHVSQKWILSGCYDKTVHLWSTTGRHLFKIPGHRNVVKAVCWLSQDDDICTFVSASQDQSCRIWEWKVQEYAVKCTQICFGHAKGIECVDASPDKTRIATGAWDNMLKIFSTSPEDNNEEKHTEKKREKKKKKYKSKGPLVTLKGHKEVVSGVRWRDNIELLTCSWDHTIRIWDAEMSSSIQELAGTKAFFDIDTSPISKLIIAASSDKNVRLFDPRSHEGQVCKSTFYSHSQWVTTVRWSMEKDNLFISGSNDCTVKLWDIRSPQVPLFDMTGHEDKVLCCDWTLPSLIVSGGTDNSLRIFRTGEGYKNVNH